MPGFRKKLFACCRASRDKDERILDYRHKGLKEIPGDVFRNQRTLEELHLDKNQFTNLAPELFSSCTNLRKLTLCDNELTQLPGSVGSCLLLEELDVSRNLLVDVPPSIVSCRGLKVLDLSVNPIHISTLAITQLFSLVKLSLNSASIEYLPAAFGRLSNLRVLELRENSIQVLPQSLSSLSQLERLDLGKNRLTEMPDVIGCLTNLHELCCDNNRISRISSRALSPLSRLIFLDLSCNHIVHLPSEPLPVSLGDLHLSSNRLRSLPESLCALENLTTLKVDNNALENLPSQLGFISTLAELNASKNRLEWLPPSIGMLRHLHTLQADDNRLTDLPGELGTCSNLSLLSLSNNKLKSLPDQLGSLRRLKVLVLSGNALTTLPYSFIGLHQLQALWLTEGQSKPVVQLHEDTDPSSGQRVLTCFLLPQRAAVNSSPIKDASNTQPHGGRSRHRNNHHNPQRLAGVEEEEENVAEGAVQGKGRDSNYAESVDGTENSTANLSSRPRRSNNLDNGGYMSDVPTSYHRRRSHRKNPMVVSMDDRMEDHGGYQSDVGSYRFHRYNAAPNRNTAAPSIHYGAPAGLCRPFDPGFPGEQPIGRPPIPLPYYNGAGLSDFQYPPASHRSYYQDMSIPSRDCMSDTESGARRRLFTGHQRHNYRNGVSSRNSMQGSQVMPPAAAIRPISGSYDWPMPGRIGMQQGANNGDDPTGCSGVPPTLAEEPVDIGGMLSSISVTSASSAAPSILRNPSSAQKQWAHQPQPQQPSSPSAIYAITHNPSSSLLQQVNRPILKNQNALPGFVGHSTPHCMGRLEPDSLISVGAGSTDSGFDAHTQSQHGGGSTTGAISSQSGVPNSATSPSCVIGGGEAPIPQDVLQRTNNELKQNQQQTNLDDSDLVSVDTKQQSTVFSAVILKNPGLGFSIAGGRGAGCSPFDDNSGVFVTKVQPDGPASSILQMGDKLLSVDGQSFEGISHVDAVNILRSCGPRVELRVSRLGSNALSPYTSDTSVFRNQTSVQSPLTQSKQQPMASFVQA